MIHVRTHDTLGSVLRWGEAAFSDSAGAGETDQILPTADVTDRQLLDTAKPRYCKVVAGRIAEMDAAEKAAVDAAATSDAQQKATGAVRIQLTVTAPANLPVPPPRAGLLVAVLNVGGNPGLALSTPTGWVVFQASGTVP